MLLVVFLLGLTSAAVAQSNNEEDLIKTAKKAAKDCIQNAQQPGYEIIGFSEVVSSCYASGFVHEVTLYKVPNHIPDGESVYPEEVAVVRIGCAGEVSNVVCGF